MKRIAFIALAFIGACGWLTARGSALAQQSGEAAIFSVTPLKKSYSQGEAVQLQLQLKNTGQRTLIVDGNLAMGGSVDPSVTGPQGQAIDWDSSFDPGQSAFQTLLPGSTLTRIVCLNCGGRDPFHTPFAQEGTYTARLEYSSPAAAAQATYFPGAAPLLQTLAATPFQFQISPAKVFFTAEPTQPVFHVGEPITFDFRLQNKAAQSVLTAYDLSLGGAVRLKVVDETGREVSWTGQPNQAAPMLSTVSPGSSIESSYAITPTNLFGTIVAGCDIRQPGTYTAYAVYMIPEPFNILQAYVGILPILIVPGPIPASPVKFTVQAAEGAPINAE